MVYTALLSWDLMFLWKKVAFFSPVGNLSKSTAFAEAHTACSVFPKAVGQRYMVCDEEGEKKSTKGKS